MPYIKENLPPFPAESDVWDKLKRETRPIVVYGMGNGADKLIEHLSLYGVEVADFFASDGFVRGQVFHQKRVKSFSEIKETYKDFVIVLSFASSREEVIEQFLKLDSAYDMYVPDMPIAGSEYFDCEFYNKNYEKIKAAAEILADEESRAIFASVINYRLSGKISHILNTYSEKGEKYELIGRDKVKTFIDAGAYNGDTAREACFYFNNLKAVYAIEPDARTFKKLSAFAEGEKTVKIVPINAAVFSESGEGEFAHSGNRNSTISATRSYEHKTATVPLIKIDDLDGGKIDYVKYDVEGAELSALIGSDETIRKYHPALSVSLYHRSEDIFSLILYLYEKYPSYKFYLRRTRCVPAWEIDLIMV